MGCEVLGQRPRQVAHQPTAGDVGHRMHRGLSQHRLHRRRVDHRGAQQLVCDGGPFGCAGVGRSGQRGPRVVGIDQHRPGQGESVAAQAGRPQADQRVAGDDGIAGDHLVTFDDADGKTGDVERIGVHRSGVFGHLATDERTTGDLAALHQAGHQQLNPVGVETTDRQIVEEEQRLGARAHQVVDHHRHKVEAHGVPAVGQPRHLELGAHPVGR